MSQSGSEQAPAAGPCLPPSIPPMPSVPRDLLWRGTPYLLVDSGFRYSLGWRDNRKTGPSFVVARLSALNASKVSEQFPLTEQGWESAWRALCAQDVPAATAIAGKIAAQEARRRTEAELSALDAGSLCYLPRMTFKGGSSGALLEQGLSYDVRFMNDRIVVSPLGAVAALVDMPYGDVETVEVGGPGAVKQSPSALVLTLGLGLLGAILGLFVLGLLGFLLGAILFGLIGAALAAASSRTETMVRIRGADDEFYFVHTEKSPETLRIELSEPLRVIDKARAAQLADGVDHEKSAVLSVPDQLTKLASLLEHGNITRDEFDHLKAKLLAQS